MEVIGKMIHTKSVVQPLEAPPQIFIVHNCSNPSVSIRCHTRIGSLSYPLPDASHEPTPTVIFLALYKGEASKDNWLIASTPTATRGICHTCECCWCWSGMTTLEVIDGGTAKKHVEIDLVLADGPFWKRHVTIMLGFCWYNAYMYGATCCTTSPRHQTSRPLPFVWLAMPSYKCTSKNPWSA